MRDVLDELIIKVSNKAEVSFSKGVTYRKALKRKDFQQEMRIVLGKKVLKIKRYWTMKVSV